MDAQLTSALRPESTCAAFSTVSSVMISISTILIFSLVEVGFVVGHSADVYIRKLPIILARGAYAHAETAPR